MSAPTVILPLLSLFPGISINRETNDAEGWTKFFITHETASVVDRFLVSLQISNITLDYQATAWPESGIYHARVYFRSLESAEDAKTRALKAISALTHDENFPMHFAADIDQIITEIAGLNTDWEPS